MIDHYPLEVDAHILQVGHHGSKTSTRAQFLDAVDPQWALIGAGNYTYGEVVLPDCEVVASLEAKVGASHVLRTDARDNLLLEAGGWWPVGFSDFRDLQETSKCKM